MIVKMNSGREFNLTPLVNWLKSLWNFETLLFIIMAPGMVLAFLDILSQH
ncbi:MAG: hypothetical protein KDI65_10615 [Alphaproteobacteria bacterium]|nr:hypothetical protein [Alphaproteobacteria bacterium]